MRRLTIDLLICLGTEQLLRNLACLGQQFPELAGEFLAASESPKESCRRRPRTNPSAGGICQGVCRAYSDIDKHQNIRIRKCPWLAFRRVRVVIEMFPEKPCPLLDLQNCHAKNTACLGYGSIHSFWYHALPTVRRS